MQTILTNLQLTAKINHKGAELISLQNNLNEEFIWNGDPMFWAKHSPILFPIVGTLNKNKYTVNNQEYSLSRHGFARDMDFELTESTESSATFVLMSTPATLENYPFHFLLSLTYELTNNKVVLKYKVENKSTSIMPFCFGGHPAFALPNSFENYSLKFEKDEPLYYSLLENNLISDEEALIKSSNGTVALNYRLFEKDALVFKKIASRHVTIEENEIPKVKIDFGTFPSLGIWTMINAPFLCIEPWFGYSDTKNSTGNIYQKEGVLSLNPKEKFRAAFSIEIL